jgi:hypothetical protein
MIPATQSAESGYSNPERLRGVPIATLVSASRASSKLDEHRKASMLASFNDNACQGTDL